MDLDGGLHVGRRSLDFLPVIHLRQWQNTDVRRQRVTGKERLQKLKKLKESEGKEVTIHSSHNWITLVMMEMVPMP